MWHCSLDLTTLKGHVVLSDRVIGKCTGTDTINMGLRN